ncbi:MAG: hypothetical protein ACYC7E_17665 [Armatimonadota bacterium]
MGFTKTTIVGSLILLVMAMGVFFARSHFLARRDACARRLVEIAARIDAYAETHPGELPTTLAGLEGAIGTVPPSTDGDPYTIATTPLRWKSGEPQPYLQDPRPHAFFNGVHVLYSDGAVRLLLPK